MVKKSSKPVKNQQEPVASTNDELTALLKLERDRFADFGKAASAWFWETDTLDRFTYMSPNVEFLTGRGAEWHYGKTRDELQGHVEMGAQKWSVFQKTINNRLPFENFVYARHIADSTIWIQTSGVPFYDEKGAFKGYRGSGKIVTDQIKVEQIAARLTVAIENMESGFSLWDMDDRLIFSNKVFKEANVNNSVPVEIGMPFFDHVSAVIGGSPEEKEKWLTERLRRHKNPGEPFEYTRKDDKTLLVKEQRLPDGLTAIITTDVTRLKNAERNSAETTEIIETAFRTIPDGILVLGHDGRPATWNDRLFSIFGIENHKDRAPAAVASDLLTVIAQHVLDGQSEPGTIDVSALILNAHQHIQLEFPLLGGKWVEFRGSPILGGGYIMTFRDFTDRKELDQMKSQFIATVSHELRTPLTSILGSLGLVRGGAVGEIPEMAQELIDVGIQNGERLLNLINDILDLEKISQQDFEMDFETIPLHVLIENAAKANIGFAKRFGVNLRVDTGSQKISVKGDRQRLMQVMDNLISNAVKFSNFGDEVEILMSRQGQHVRISVTDHGPGVARKHQKSIFDRFVQADSSDTRSIAGTGLGLSICKEIILGHNGRINLHSVRSMGSTFYFELPVIEAQAT